MHTQLLLILRNTLWGWRSTCRDLFIMFQMTKLRQTIFFHTTKNGKNIYFWFRLQIWWWKKIKAEHQTKNMSELYSLWKLITFHFFYKCSVFESYMQNRLRTFKNMFVNNIAYVLTIFVLTFWKQLNNQTTFWAIDSVIFFSVENTSSGLLQELREFTGSSGLFLAVYIWWFNSSQFFTSRIIKWCFSYMILLHIKGVTLYFC